MESETMQFDQDDEDLRQFIDFLVHLNEIRAYILINHVQEIAESLNGNKIQTLLQSQTIMAKLIDMSKKQQLVVDRLVDIFDALRLDPYGVLPEDYEY